MRWPPIHVPLALKRAPWPGQRKPLPFWLTMFPWCGQTRDSVTKLVSLVRTTANGEPEMVTSAMPPTEASAG